MVGKGKVLNEKTVVQASRFVLFHFFFIDFVPLYFVNGTSLCVR